MRVVITKTVPGYQTGQSYSVSDDLAVHLIKNNLGRAETGCEQTAILRHIAKVKKMKSGQGSIRFEIEPEVDPENPKGKDSKSQTRKRAKSVKKKGKK